MQVRRNIGWVLLIAISVCIKIFSLFPDAVEKYYSTGAYPVIAHGMRILTGWVPISVGDILYFLVGIRILVKAFQFIKRIIQRQVSKPYFIYMLKRALAYVLGIYILFNLLWGLNYDRKGIGYQLGLEEKAYSNAELKDLVQDIVFRLNNLDSTARITRNRLQQKKNLFSGCGDSFKRLSAMNPVFAYPAPSIKSSLFSYLGNYLGFTGYYNPFSGEAQVNTTVPVYVQPFTSCHEIGHQLGYAKENEANFVGFLAARSSQDPAFAYSVYFDLYLYGAAELYQRDSTLLVPLREQLRPDIRKDFRELRQFTEKYKNPFEPLIRKLYGKYLQANSQPQGIFSYNEVIGRLIAYRKKFGASAL